MGCCRTDVECGVDLVRTLKPAGIHRNWPEPTVTELARAHRNNRIQSDSTGGSPRFRYAVPALISEPRFTLESGPADPIRDERP